MTDESDDRLDDGTDSRRSFMKKGALAGGGLALGGSAFAQQDDGQDDGEDDGQDQTPTDDGQNGGQEDGDTALMLLPDAVPNADFTVESDEIDWAPWESDDQQNGTPGDGGTTPTETDDGGIIGEETETAAEDVNNQQETDTETDDGGGIGQDTPTDDGETGQDGAQSYTTYIASYGFSASAYAHLLVPEDVDVEQGQDYQVGDVQEVVTDPTGQAEDGDGGGGIIGGGDDGGDGEDQATFVRVGFSESGGGGLL